MSNDDESDDEIRTRTVSKFGARMTGSQDVSIDTSVQQAMGFCNKYLNSLTLLTLSSQTTVGQEQGDPVFATCMRAHSIYIRTVNPLPKTMLYVCMRADGET